ncbi:Interferon alpha-inducible protein 27, mitochondrial [Pseudolycoriella hygida]|uniref:Interferon alpha-inducible protein 27, mitochondrial n=1 Tax=Pseudolycoriella hygida TaxID=35572 RepID=A0A9Q0N2J8_9DIPT|nr:Interferon alpha-inducible protein 27, mitochondrial [Pseudolycoriella hygida]
MSSKEKIYFVVHLLLIISSTVNASKSDDWTFTDIMKYAGMAAVGGAGAVVAAPVVLAASGFTTTGIAAGSLAAVSQASLGSVAGGTVFAALQSAGAAGIGGTASAILATTGASIGAGVAKMFDSKKNKED